MKRNLLEKLPQGISRILQLIGGYADQRGIGCYLVGGVVRDLLLEKENLDIDIVIEADAIEFSKALSQKYQTAITIYPRFRTTTLVWPKNIVADFVSARKESYPAPGALPAVEFGTLRDDLFRRDFTINALAVSLNQPKYGLLIDEYQGLKDLKDRQIRIFHHKSFQDDPTRVLRAVRFSERLGFGFERDTRALLEEAIKGKFYRSVTAGRYFEEFKKILKETDPARALRCLDELHALDFLDEHFKFTAEKEKYLGEVGKILEWVQEFCPDVRSHATWLVYFMILVDDYPVETAKEMLGRFAFSRHESNKIISSKLEYEVIKRLDRQNLKPSQIYQVLKGSSIEELIFFLTKTEKTPAESCIKDFLTEYRMVKLLLKGDDLMKMGIKDGKKIGAALGDLLEKKIDVGISTREEEIKFLEEKGWTESSA